MGIFCSKPSSNHRNSRNYNRNRSNGAFRRRIEGMFFKLEPEDVTSRAYIPNGQLQGQNGAQINVSGRNGVQISISERGGAQINSGGRSGVQIISGGRNGVQNNQQARSGAQNSQRGSSGAQNNRGGVQTNQGRNGARDEQVMLLKEIAYNITALRLEKEKDERKVMPFQPD